MASSAAIAAAPASQSSDRQETGMIVGNVVDQSGTAAFGADVTLTTNG
ncbi:MAG: hypothetical protein ACRD4R_11645 [Candidatus Acidiferrales bacterium]